MKRKIDDVGRIVIPIALRRHLHLSAGDTLEITFDNNSHCICLSPSVNTCVFCNSLINLIEMNKNLFVCSKCISKISSKNK